MQDAAEVIAEGIRVWIVEDDMQYAEAVAQVLNETAGYACTGMFYEYEDVQARLDTRPAPPVPDVVLMDINLPGVNGIAGVADLKARAPDVRVVMLTVNDVAEHIFNAFRQGACGYLLKDAPVERILAGIREAYDGAMPMPPAVAAKVLAFFAQAPQRKHDYNLTQREKEVLLLMADGLAHKQIAAQLYVSPFTVENHLRSIYQKLHVNSGVQAVSKAFREGLL